MANEATGSVVERMAPSSIESHNGSWDEISANPTHHTPKPTTRSEIIVSKIESSRMPRKLEKKGP